MGTKEIISNAMFYLLKIKNFEKITVQMVLDECGVSRSTFYKYFSDKYDLMNWCYQSYVDTLLLNVEYGKWKDTLHLIFQFINEKYEYFERAVEIQGKNSFCDFLYNYSYDFYRRVYLNNVKQKELNTEERIALEFNCMGAVHIVSQWVRNGRKESAKDMADWTFQLIPDIYRKYL